MRVLIDLIRALFRWPIAAPTLTMADRIALVREARWREQPPVPTADQIQQAYAAERAARAERAQWEIAAAIEREGWWRPPGEETRSSGHWIIF